MTKDATRLLAEHVAKKSKGSVGLSAKKAKPPRTKAGLAGELTGAMAASPSSGCKQTKAMSRSDKALRRMYENAEPGRCHTLEEIATVMNITRERVRQIEYQAKKNFRNRLTVLLKSEGVTPEDLAAVLAAANLET